METKQLIEEFDQVLRKYCEPLYRRLQPPLDSSQIDFFLEKLKINIPEIRELFKWKNGIANDGEFPTNAYSYSDFGVIAPLEYLSEIQDEMAGQYWEITKVPIIVSYSGDFLLYESDKSLEEFGQLFLYCPTMGLVYETESYYDSISTMLQTINKCYKAGAFSYNPDSMLFDSDTDMTAQISKSLNPKSAFWRS